jgi:tRNA U34 5-carboxymethylaminomethyl modifying GTPase MnmE/TrmE
MTVYQQQKSRTAQLLDIALEVAGRLNQQDAVDSLTAEKERLTNDELVVAVAGEFKRGKSMLLNNLLGRPYCPVGNAVTTSVVTAVRYGETERVTVHYSDAEGSFQQKEIEVSDIPQFVSEEYNRQNGLQVRMVEIESPLPSLADRLAFLDTPGV